MFQPLQGLHQRGYTQRHTNTANSITDVHVIKLKYNVISYNSSNAENITVSNGR